MKIEMTKKAYLDIAQFYDFLHSDNGLIEGFFLKPDGETKATQYFDNKDEFIQTVAAYNANGFTCYAGIQPRKTEFKGRTHSATGKDVSALRLLAIDCDSCKPVDDKGNKLKINATDAEKQACLDVVAKIRKVLIGLGYQKPLVTDSGSGHWLFLQIPEIPISDANRPEIVARLKKWGVKFKEKFQETGIDIDEKVFELHRLTKIPGTKVFSYPDETERPQRIAAILTPDPVIADEKLKNDFLTMPVEIPAPETKTAPTFTAGGIEPNIDRMIERCSILRFLEEKTKSGVSLPHAIRLGLSTFSLAVNDLDNDLTFIKRMLSGCPDYNEHKTRRYLELNQGKSAPYGCHALKELTAKHFKDFKPEICACKLPVTHDKAGIPRKPSPIRFAGVMAEDLSGLFSKVNLEGDPFQDFLKMKEFSETVLSQVDAATAKTFFDTIKETANLNKEKTAAFMKARKAATDEDTTQAQRLIELAADAELFKSPDDQAFATFAVSGHRETSALKSGRFRSWLKRKFYQETDRPPSSQPLQDAIGILESKAIFEGATYQVYTRIAGNGGNVYLDLANQNWEAVEITSSGWQVVQNPSVKFRRPKGMGALPYPAKDGNINLLKKYINLSSDNDFKLVVAWLIGALKQEGSFPLLAFNGEAGAAKSSGSEALKRAIDPASSPLRTLPSNERDLMIAGNNNWILAFDNVSTIPSWLSDALCRLSTGGGLSTRELYSDDGEVIFDLERPVILNGISDYVNKHDLADRSVIVSMANIPEKKKRTKKQLWKEFEIDHASILGALCDSVSCALRNINNVKLEKMTRMADFCLWITAAESSLNWHPGDFMKVYRGNIQEMVQTTVDADSVATAIKEFLNDYPEGFNGTPTELLRILTDRVDDQTAKAKQWPKAPHVLTGKLRRAATSLRSFGIEVQTGIRLADKQRGVSIRQKEAGDAGDASFSRQSEHADGYSGDSENLGTLHFGQETLQKEQASPENEKYNQSYSDVKRAGDASTLGTLDLPSYSQGHVSRFNGDAWNAGDASFTPKSEHADGGGNVRVEI
ncbi:MAG: hypothetical protein KBA28_09685 [Syntrophaceae bacterium]|nr:hypothetical protein [Syntrophaceae bacterium]